MNVTGVSLRPLGRTALRISALGLGCWQFSKGHGMVGRFWPTMQQQDIADIVRVSLEGGINWFDTAEVYGKGQSEEALAEALESLGDRAEQALVATKWWPLLRSAASITQTIDERLRALHGHRIDLYQIHQPFSISGVPAQLDAMAALLRDGKIGSAGVSNFNAARMREAHAVLERHGFPLASNQVRYSLLDRRIERNGVLEAAKALGITIIAYSPLEQGLLSGKFHREPALLRGLKGPRKWLSSFRPAGLARTKPLIDLLEHIAKDYGATTSQVALNWLIHAHGETVVAIPGASKIRHAEENIGTLTFRLTDAEIRRIDELSRQVSIR